MADEHKASRARAAERVKLYREQSGLRAQQGASVKLNINIGEELYLFALKPTPTRLSLSGKSCAFQQRACYLPQAATQDMTWSTPLTWSEGTTATQGTAVICEIERTDTQPRLFQGVPEWTDCATKMSLSAMGWTLHFTYTEAKGVLRLISVDHDTQVEQSQLQALRELTTQPVAASSTATKKKRRTAEDALIESKKQHTSKEAAGTTAPAAAGRRY